GAAGVPGPAARDDGGVGTRSRAELDRAAGPGRPGVGQAGGALARQPAAGAAGRRADARPGTARPRRALCRPGPGRRRRYDRDPGRTGPGRGHRRVLQPPARPGGAHLRVSGDHPPRPGRRPGRRVGPGARRPAAAGRPGGHRPGGRLGPAAGSRDRLGRAGGRRSGAPGAGAGRRLPEGARHGARGRPGRALQLRHPAPVRGIPRRHRRGRMSSRWIRLTAIVAEREIRQRGRSRAFLISTIVLLLVVVAGVAIPAILAHNAKPQRVGVVGGQLTAMTEIVREAGRLTGTGVTVVPQPSLAAAEAALRSGELDVVLANDSEVVVKQVSVADSSGSGGGLASAIADVAGLSKLVGHLPPGAADRGVTLRVRGLTPPSASLSRRLTGLFTVVLVWVLISAYGSQIAMGVGEEKQNRIVEVILASVRPIQLLVGKVTGIGALALAQAAL